MKDGLFEAMEATFALQEAIEKHDLTVDDLTLIASLSIENGHLEIIIALQMMSVAIDSAEEVIEARAS